VRRLIDAHNEGLRDAYARQAPADVLLDQAEQRILSIADAEATGATVRIDVVMQEVIEAINVRKGGGVTGLASGLSDLDDATTGFQPENLIYLAGRTSAGKTSLALNMIDHIAVNSGRPVLFVSLEMSRREIGERLLVARSGVDGHMVRTGRVGDRERVRLSRADDQLRAAPLFIDDTPGRTAAQIVANARRYHAREGVEMVAVDLINHVEGEDRRESRREQMCVISRRFKGLARELKIPVLVLAQLNRGPDQREGNRPRKSDLKECGNLEEDADLVLLLHRPDYYDPNDQPGVGVVIVDKNRQGPTRDIRVCFRKDVMKFEDLAREPEFIPAADF
jgi:replicative DNA helicase